MIMTSYIRTPQGDLPLISQEKAKWLRILRWGACLAGGFIGALIMGAGVIGFYQAAHAHASTPTTHITKACKGIPNSMMEKCIGLSLRPGYSITQKDGSKVDTPNGAVLVKECRGQYKSEELRVCLSQPIG